VESVQLAQQFFKVVDVRDDQFEAIQKAYDHQIKMEEQGAAQKAVGGKPGGSGHSLASPGNAANTGHMTKPTKRIK
jgi:hypothetical protein